MKHCNEKRYNSAHRILANTARHLVNVLSTTRTTIGAVVSEWNNFVKRAGRVGTYDFPTTGYTRKAQLIADLNSAADQLEALAECRATVYDIDAAHDEALLMNMPVESLVHVRLFPETIISEARAHAEALELNELRDFRIDAPEPAQVARTAPITARLQSHIIAPVFILLMLLIGGSFNADAMMAGMLGSTMANLDSVEPVDNLKPAVPVQHWVCGGQQVSYDGSSITVDGWRFTRPLDLIKKQEAVTFAAAYENTNRQMVMLVTADGQTIFAGDYYPQVFCHK